MIWNWRQAVYWAKFAGDTKAFRMVKTRANLVKSYRRILLNRLSGLQHGKLISTWKNER